MALVLPVLAQMTTWAPCLFATEMAVVMPRSLNDAGRVEPLVLDVDAGPGQLGQVLARDERGTALLEGHHRSAARASAAGRRTRGSPRATACAIVRLLPRA